MTQSPPKTPETGSVHAPHLYPPYTSSVKRAPHERLIPLPAALENLHGPVFGTDRLRPDDNDTTRNARVNGEPLGERILVRGRLLDSTGRPVRGALIETWQANAAGRYIHQRDRHDAPLDPNFTGTARMLTDEYGEYELITIRPGAYPWGNHPNAWRPAHIHFSVFGTNFTQRLVSQMYFPGDPLLAHDPIYQGIPDEKGRQRLISRFDLALTQPNWALGFRFDIVLGGSAQTPFEEPDHDH
ncbi:protocatechuate 3,4-dioxygenase, beta subunit (plasmid) [Deinococcus geothermalis DSM 11300]|uniref:Protocatechuate 3,4-dioxygenase, beta subunit n=1 Tax=Deinococcus geothermalis (strain DSM 11300 / CIP 105573 / AG-3a) TaxID=319795 RepID=Q1J3Z6_DEIGD|nr:MULTISPECIES: protocatechuate 3,4-dioxygenase subunit beta [Deinococcus]ABF43822.1 protocatechuate 3,4-dioxygenase, beta subunit [Deinococcus geothermalis DSM 11300]MBI0446522.1 protocatechuate 3,4-dioxygenase subunit beta [Deinococcus sp. DB0503]